MKKVGPDNNYCHVVSMAVSDNQHFYLGSRFWGGMQNNAATQLPRPFPAAALLCYCCWLQEYILQLALWWKDL